MADSRAERRWSKDPRMATTRSVMVWLFWRDSLMNDALSIRVSISKGTPISLTFFFLLFQISSFFFSRKKKTRREENLWRVVGEESACLWQVSTVQQAVRGCKSRTTGVRNFRSSVLGSGWKFRRLNVKRRNLHWTDVRFWKLQSSSFLCFFFKKKTNLFITNRFY